MEDTNVITFDKDGKEVCNGRLIAYMDSSNRTLFGTLIEENDTTMTIKNPVVVNIEFAYIRVCMKCNAQNHRFADVCAKCNSRELGQPQQTGALALQLIPAWPKEFQAVNTEPVYFKYNKNTISVRIAEFQNGFDFRLVSQYEAMFAERKPIVKEEPKTINLFD